MFGWPKRKEQPKDTAHCEWCNDPGIILLNGQYLYCWEHYRIKMAIYRNTLEIAQQAKREAMGDGKSYPGWKIY